MPEPQDNGVPNLDELSARLSSLQLDNQAESAVIAQMGSQLDSASLVALRVETFINFVFQRLGAPTAEIRQALSLMFEIEFHEKLTETLKEVKSEVRKQTLTGAGRPVSKADLKLLWEQQQKRNGSVPPPGFSR